MIATVEELDRAKRWLSDRLTSLRADALPFSFDLAGRPFSESTSSWNLECASREVDTRRTEHVVTCYDPQSGVQVRCVATEYQDHAAVEWVLYLSNEGTGDTPVISDLQALDMTLLPPGPNCTLHYAKGALCTVDDFAPVARPVNPKATIQLTPGGGRSSSEVLPFFNLETLGEGMILAIGWTGEWALRVSRDEGGQVRLQAGLEQTHFCLHPGERVRSPRILLLFWSGERLRSQNLLRRFLLDHHRPTVAGELLHVPFFVGNWGGSTAQVHEDVIRSVVEHDLPVEYLWIDAEWFGDGIWWKNPGDWRIKSDLYPQGMKPLSDMLHRAGRKFLLWFEPERVSPGTPWYDEHADWLLSVRPEQALSYWGSSQADRVSPAWALRESRQNQFVDGDRLFDLGNPAARDFLTDFISERINEYGIDCYRHDANIAPLEFWRAADAPERQGITEMHWIEGLYAFWDELLRRHPGLIIDNCASGGRRIDLEMIGRSTPFWRTDYPKDPIAKQCHTYGLLSWVPLNATGSLRIFEADDYAVYSTLCGGMVFEMTGSPMAGHPQPPIPEDFPFDEVKRKLRRCLEIRDFYEGDYYPLTEYSQARDAWMAYQLDRPESGDGLVVVLKRPLSGFTEALLALHGLQTAARYEITNMDTAERQIAPGSSLMSTGLQVRLEPRPAAALLHYRRLDV